MKIGIDATCLANMRGYGRYTREIMAELARQATADELVLFADERAARASEIRGANVRTVVVPQRVSPTLAAAADSARSVGDMLRLTRAVWRERPDVFFSPTVYSYFPLPPRLPAVVTFYDAIAERFPHLTLPSVRARLFWRAKTRLAREQADLVLAISPYAADEIAAAHGIPRERIRVATAAPSADYQPVDDRREIIARAARYGVPPGRSWIIYVGGFNPHKNVDAIVRSHSLAIVDVDEPPLLLLVGTRHADVFHGAGDAIDIAIRACGTADLVRWTGFVPDEDLRYLLAGAVTLVLASESEGFGLPAVEAAACGTPVVATTASPLPELLEGGGIWVEPRDEHAMTAAMRSFIRDEKLRATMGARAREQASRLSWSAAGQAALAAIHEVASAAATARAPQAAPATP